MNDTPKTVFSHTLTHTDWKNTTLANGDLVEEVNQLKNQTGGDLIAYGGAKFVSSLIEANLIDEYHLFINPAAIGEGLTIFSSLTEKRNLQLKQAKAFACGITVLHYEPK